MDAPVALDYQARNPFRAVDYRWQDALRAVQRGAGSSGRLDPETETAAAYLRALPPPRGRDPNTRLEGRWPGLPAAHRLSSDDGPARWELCGRLLAGQTDEEIAAHTGLAPEAVRWFEALFFRVRDRLHARDWVYTQVIGGGPWCEFGREDLGKVWMFLGYRGGPRVLDVVLAVTQDRPLPAWVRAPAGEPPRVHAARLRLSCRLAVASVMLRTPADAAVVRRLHRAWRRLERATHGREDRSGDQLAHQLDLLAGLGDGKRAAKGRRQLPTGPRVAARGVPPTRCGRPSALPVECREREELS
jgi:hypothetical protein